MNSGQRLRLAFDIHLPLSAYLPEEQVFRLLANIEKTGSISRSAKAVGMSYSTAWRRLKESEAGLGTELLAHKKGGAGGGGTMLTKEGSIILNKYSKMMEDAEQLVKKCCLEYFPPKDKL